ALLDSCSGAIGVELREEVADFVVVLEVRQGRRVERIVFGERSCRVREPAPVECRRENISLLGNHIVKAEHQLPFGGEAVGQGRSTISEGGGPSALDRRSRTS